MNKINQFIILSTMVVTMIVFSSASLVSATSPITMSFQQSDVIDGSGDIRTSGDVNVTIYGTATGGSPLYQELFANSVSSGDVNVILGLNVSNPLSLDFNTRYHIDFSIDGFDYNHTLSNGTVVDRIPFISPYGDASSIIANTTDLYLDTVGDDQFGSINYTQTNIKAMYFNDSTNGQTAAWIGTFNATSSGGRLTIGAQGVDNVAEFTNYGLFLPKQSGDGRSFFTGFDVEIGFDNNNDDDVIYFDHLESFRWDESEGKFNFSKGVDINGAVDIYTSTSATEHSLNIIETSENLQICLDRPSNTYVHDIEFTENGSVLAYLQVGSDGGVVLGTFDTDNVDFYTDNVIQARVNGSNGDFISYNALYENTDDRVCTAENGKCNQTTTPTAFTGSPGSIIFLNASGELSEENNEVFYNLTNKRMAVGKNDDLSAKFSVNEERVGSSDTIDGLDSFVSITSGIQSGGGTSVIGSYVFSGNATQEGVGVDNVGGIFGIVAQQSTGDLEDVFGSGGIVFIASNNSGNIKKAVGTMGGLSYFPGSGGSTVSDFYNFEAYEILDLGSTNNTAINHTGLYINSFDIAQNSYGIIVEGVKNYSFWAQSSDARFDDDIVGVELTTKDDLTPLRIGTNFATALYIDNQTQNIGLFHEDPEYDVHQKVAAGQTEYRLQAGSYFVELKTTDNTYASLQSGGGSRGINIGQAGIIGVLVSNNNLGVKHPFPTRDVDILGSNGTTPAQFRMTTMDNVTWNDLEFVRRRGSLTNPNVSVETNEIISDLRFTAADGADNDSQAVKIQVRLNGTPGPDSMPGALDIYLTNISGQKPKTLSLESDQSVRAQQKLYEFGDDRVCTAENGKCNQTGSGAADGDFNISDQNIVFGLSGNISVGIPTGQARAKFDLKDTTVSGDSFRLENNELSPGANVLHATSNSTVGGTIGLFDGQRSYAGDVLVANLSSSGSGRGLLVQGGSGATALARFDSEHKTGNLVEFVGDNVTKLVQGTGNDFAQWIVWGDGRQSINTSGIDQALKVNGGGNFSGTVYGGAFSSNSPLRLQTQDTDRIIINDTTGEVNILSNLMVMNNITINSMGSSAQLVYDGDSFDVDLLKGSYSFEQNLTVFPTIPGTVLYGLTVRDQDDNLVGFLGEANVTAVNASVNVLALNTYPADIAVFTILNLSSSESKFSVSNDAVSFGGKGGGTSVSTRSPNIEVYQDDQDNTAFSYESSRNLIEIGTSFINDTTNMTIHSGNLTGGYLKFTESSNQQNTCQISGDSGVECNRIRTPASPSVFEGQNEFNSTGLFIGNSTVYLTSNQVYINETSRVTIGDPVYILNDGFHGLSVNTYNTTGVVTIAGNNFSGPDLFLLGQDAFVLKLSADNGQGANIIFETNRSNNPSDRFWRMEAQGNNDFIIQNNWNNSGGYENTIWLVSNYSSQGSMVGILKEPENYAFEVNGDAGKTSGGTSWQAISDNKTKRDIVDYTVGLTEINSLNVKKWKFNGLAGTKDGDEWVGIIANEVNDTFPMAVKEVYMDLNQSDNITTKDLVYTFNSDPVFWAMVNSVQELDNKIISLEEKIKVLEQK